MWIHPWQAAYTKIDTMPLFLFCLVCWSRRWERGRQAMEQENKSHYKLNNLQPFLTRNSIVGSRGKTMNAMYRNFDRHSDKYLCVNFFAFSHFSMQSSLSAFLCSLLFAWWGINGTAFQTFRSIFLRHLIQNFNYLLV